MKKKIIGIKKTIKISKMKRYFAIAALLMIGAFFSNKLLAQNNLEERLSKIESNLEKKSPAWDKIVKSLNPGGYLQIGYNWADDNTSTFKITRAMLNFSGNLYSGKYGSIDYKFNTSFAGTPKILDLFVVYMPIKEFGIKVGEFKSPITYENEGISPTNLEFVNYANSVQRLARMEGDICDLSTGGRDIGIEFLGSAFHKDGYSLLSYELALFNGYKLNTTDNNKSKDIVGKIMINPIKQLTLSTYFQRGEGAYPDFDEITQSFIPQTTDKYIVMWRYGGGAYYKPNWGFLRGEFIGGKTGVLKSVGGYLAGGVWVAKNLMAVARADYFNADTKSSDIYEMDYTAGFRWEPHKNLDLRLNYTYKNLTGGFRDKSSIYTQLTVKF